jgi:putative photosynthetic complex assembly protein
MSAGADHDQIYIPAGFLRAAAGLVLLSICAAAIASWTGFGKSSLNLAPVAESRQIRFEENPTGAVAVFDTGSDEAFAVLKPGQDGFVQSVVRSMSHQRRMHGLSPIAGDFRLNQHVDGRLSLQDLATGNTMSLEGFGTGNTQSFAKLLSSSTSR